MNQLEAMIRALMGAHVAEQTASTPMTKDQSRVPTIQWPPAPTSQNAQIPGSAPILPLRFTQ